MNPGEQACFAFTQTQSPARRFPRIFLAAFLGVIFPSGSTVAQTGVTRLNPVEKWVVEMVTAGQVANLSRKFPDERDRKLSGQFLENLLTGRLPGVKPHRNGVLIRSAVIDELIDVRNAQIPWEVWLDNCEFNSGLNFTGANFAKTVSFADSTFKNKEQGVSFNRMKVGEAAFFTKTVFEGPVDFIGTDIASNFEAQEAQFRSKAQTVQLQMKCGRKGIFIGATFAGPVSFADSTFLDLMIGGMDLDAAPVPKIDLSRSSVERRLKIERIRIHDLVAQSLHVKGPAALTDLIIEHSADLSDGDFATLDLSSSVWPTDGKGGRTFHMRGMKYQYLCANSDESNSHRALLKLADQSAFTADVYGNLEAFFLRQGYGADADQAFIAGKRRERDESLRRKEYLRWFGSQLLDWLVGYGRHPSQAGYFCVFFISLGFVLFAPERMELQKTEDAPRAYNRFWYSLGLFLPFANLEADKVWTPKAEQGFLRNYVRVHMLLGWILIPILLAALTGLIK